MSSQKFCWPATSKPATPIFLKCCPSEMPCGTSTLPRIPRSATVSFLGSGFFRAFPRTDCSAGGGGPPRARKRTSSRMAACAPSPSRNQEAPRTSARSLTGRWRIARSSAACTVAGLASCAATTNADRSRDPTCSPRTASISEVASRYTPMPTLPENEGIRSFSRSRPVVSWIRSRSRAVSAPAARVSSRHSACGAAEIRRYAEASPGRREARSGGVIKGLKAATSWSPERFFSCAKKRTWRKSRFSGLS